MGWQDRSYSYREEPGGWQKIWRWILNGSVSLGEWWGISVRVHASLILFGVLSVLFANARGGLGMQDAIVSSLILFGIVLMHEFGHCFAARRVGGRADHILLWPLGGLAYVDAPKRPGPTFQVAFGGPLVNIVICILTGTLLLMMSGGKFNLPINPLSAFLGTQRSASVDDLMLISSNSVAYYAWWIYSVSYLLLAFNLLPIFPLDGGRIFQALAWPFMGFYRSMELACNVGVIGAIGLGIVGIFSSFWLVFLAVSGYQTCMRTKMTLREQADAAWQAERFSDGGGFSMGNLRSVAQPRSRKNSRPMDDRKTWRDFKPIEIWKRKKRRKQFERLMKDD